MLGKSLTDSITFNNTRRNVINKISHLVIHAYYIKYKSCNEVIDKVSQLVRRGIYVPLSRQ